MIAGFGIALVLFVLGLLVSGIKLVFKPAKTEDANDGPNQKRSQST